MNNLDLYTHRDENLKKGNVRLFVDEFGTRKSETIENDILMERLHSSEIGVVHVGHIEHTQSMLLGELSGRHIHRLQMIWDEDIEIVNIWLHMPVVQKNTEELLLDVLNASELWVKELIFVHDIFHQRWSLTPSEIK